MIGGASVSVFGEWVKHIALATIVDALDEPIKAFDMVLDKAARKLDAKGKENKKKLFEKHPGTEVLVLKQQRFTWSDQFNVYDEFETVKYTVKGEFLSIKRHLHVYDVRGKEIGTVREKLISLRSPLSLEMNPKDFVFKEGGKKSGSMKSKWAFGKRYYKIDLNGLSWSVEGNIFGWQYKILDGLTEVVNVSQEVLAFGDTYVIKYTDKKYELIILMIVLALDISNAPKKTVAFKNTLHHKSGHWL